MRIIRVSVPQSGGVIGNQNISGTLTVTGLSTLGMLLVNDGTNNFLSFNKGGGAGGGDYENTTLGYQAGNALAGTGYANTLIGKGAGILLNGTGSDGASNTIVGYTAGALIVTGSFNTLIGTAAGISLVAGSDSSTFVGYHAGLNSKNVSGNNHFFGTFAGKGHATTATGISNCAFGDSAMGAYTSADLNSGFGNDTLAALTSGDNNSAFGRGALMGVTTGSNNIGLGYTAGDNISTGSNNLIVGYNIDAPSATLSNQMSIGNLIYGAGVDGTGTTVSAGNVGIRTATFGTNAVGVFAILTGTVPTTAPADTLQIFSVDRSAGNAVMGWFQEYAPYGGVAVASTTKVPVYVNGTVYYLLATTVE